MSAAATLPRSEAAFRTRATSGGDASSADRRGQTPVVTRRAVSQFAIVTTGSAVARLPAMSHARRRRR
jgi:hypothetical protein